MPHSIDIYRNADKYVTVKPDDTSSQTKAIMGDNSIQLDFELSYEAKFKINDWCTVFGEIYIIAENPPPVTKVSRYRFKYSIEMKSEACVLEKIQYLFYGPFNTLTIPDFPLTGNSKTFIDLLISNTERYVTMLTANGWGFGSDLTPWIPTDIVSTGYKNIVFSADNCLSALSKVADAFGTEWWVVGKKIFLAKVVNDTGITLKHGRQKGLYEISRQSADNSRIVTAIYAYGGKTNIPYDYGNERLRLFSSTPVLPPFMGSNENIYGVIEQVVVFDDIFPTRTGKVTAVDATNFYKFTDVTMDFDLNANLLPGLSAKVAFNTGQLSGYQFEISRYDNGTKTLTLLKNKDETSIDVPSASLKPQIGDEYVFIDIKLPPQYVADAENRLFVAAEEYLNANSVPKFTFNITLDPTYVRNNKLSFSIGDMVWITDSDLEIDKKIRVVQTQRNIVKQDQYTLTLSDEVSKGTIASINSNLSTAQQNISNINNSLQGNTILNSRLIVKQTTDISGMSPLYVDNTTDEIYKKV